MLNTLHTLVFPFIGQWFGYLGAIATAPTHIALRFIFGIENTPNLQYVLNVVNAYDGTIIEYTPTAFNLLGDNWFSGAFDLLFNGVFELFRVFMAPFSVMPFWATFVVFAAITLFMFHLFKFFKDIIL